MIRTNSVVLVAALLAGCSETNFTQLTQEDLFQQNRLNTVDVLLVVDNSCSMIEEQTKLGSNFGSFIHYFDDADVDWHIGVVTTDVLDTEHFAGRLIGGDDEIILTDPQGRTLDAVGYDRTWPLDEGVVAALDPSWYSASGNDEGSHWCSETTGTPGGVNTGCGGGGGGADPRLSDVIITEFLADPKGVADDVGEWFELTNIGDADVDLSGYYLRDNGRNLYTIPQGTAIGVGASLVFGRTTDTVPGALPVGADFTLNNHQLFLTRDTEGPEEIFAEIVAQGTSGTGLEMGLEGARLAVTEPLLSGENAGFVRDEASLSILVVSDEEDSSPLAVDDYLNIFTDVKGDEAYRDHHLFNVSAVVGNTPPEFEGEPSCSSANGVASYGSRYVYAANRTEGLQDSICAEDFSPIVDRLGLTLSGLESEFALSRVPVVTSLKVSLYAEPTKASKIRDLTIDEDFTYNVETNSIRFENDQVPESQQYILAEYLVQSGS